MVSEEPVKTSTCAHDRCALQQLALNVYVKHSDQIISVFRLSTTTRSSQCSTTGLTKAVVCAILSVGWCI